MMCACFDPAPVKKFVGEMMLLSMTPAGWSPPQFLTLRSAIVPYPTTHTLTNTIRRHAAGNY
jgi:hypothetical protein